VLSVSVRTALASAPALPLARAPCPAALDGAAVLFLRVAVHDGEVVSEVLAVDEDGLAAVVDETCHDVAVGRERKKSHSKSRSRSCYNGDSGFHVGRVTKRLLRRRCGCRWILIKVTRRPVLAMVSSRGQGERWACGCGWHRIKTIPKHEREVHVAVLKVRGGGFR
jgi:hypothetical protein